ncbi:hypothetical protein [Companilactobacillus insicii]|uniref:hypothetical protein n=1 Tax=Companilactobacillus insicii TaxID=1732567 RepID=UPI000F774428|nr:hypothetical protein [Companilactobacillus insicii]
MKTSATSILIERIPKILSRKTSEHGLTFDELWFQLERDKVASKYLRNDKNEKRLGLLQGISTRVKNGRISGITIIDTESGKKWFAVDDKLFVKMTEFKRHLDVLSSLKFVDEDNKDNAKLTDLDNKIGVKIGELHKLSDEVIKLMKQQAVNQRKENHATADKVENTKDSNNIKGDA